MMKLPEIAKSGIQTCIAALQIWGGFFFVTAVLQIAFPELSHTWLIVVLVGILALGAITYHWVTKIKCTKGIGELGTFCCRAIHRYRYWSSPNRVTAGQ
jgi:hypothetical protein